MFGTLPFLSSNKKNYTKKVTSSKIRSVNLWMSIQHSPYQGGGFSVMGGDSNGGHQDMILLNVQDNFV